MSATLAFALTRQSCYSWYHCRLIWNVPFVERSAPADRRAQRQRRQQLLEAARSRYPALSYQEKGALVDELVELSGYTVNRC